MAKNKKLIKIMGILNITPDSFSDGGEYFDNAKKAAERARQMIKEGADIIDIGGESTRPGADKISGEEELRRILPVIDAINKEIKNPLFSVDTNKADVAEQALKNGAYVINSMGGFLFDKKLAITAAKYNAKMIIYHIKGLPKTMQEGEISYGNIIDDISMFFQEQIDFGTGMGMRREQFILDPGIGFGKTVEHNIEIIRRLKEFKKFELPICVGLSRKRHLGIIMTENMMLKEIPAPLERIEAGLAETAIAILNGADIIRTHDAGATARFISVLREFI